MEHCKEFSPEVSRTSVRLLYLNILKSVCVKAIRQKHYPPSERKYYFRNKQTNPTGTDILTGSFFKPSLSSVLQPPSPRPLFSLYDLDIFKVYFHARMIRSMIASLACSMKRCSHNTNTAWHSQIPESYSLVLGSRCNHPATPCIKC